MESLVSNQEIFNKINFGSKIKARGTDGKFHCLYKTTCGICGKIYVGVFSTKRDPYEDKYIGCGIRCASNCNGRETNRFVEHVIEHGIHNFGKEILLYFNYKNLSYEAESVIVDENFILDERVLNTATGGRMAKTRLPWTNVQRAKQSNKMKNKVRRGIEHHGIQRVFAFGLFYRPMKIEIYESLTECEAALGISQIAKYGHIYHEEYVIMKDYEYQKKRLSKWLKIWYKDIKWVSVKMKFDLTFEFKHKCKEDIVRLLCNRYSIQFNHTLKLELYDFCKKHKEGN